MSLTERERAPAAEQAGDISSVNPELSVGSHAEVLRELLTVDDEVAAVNRPKIYEAAAQLSATIFNPKAKRALELYAGIAEWYMLGKPGEPMPVGLDLHRPSGYVKEVRPGLDSSFPYLHRGIEDAHTKLARLGFNEAEDAIVSHLDMRLDALEHVISDFIRGTNEYAVLAAFDQPKPQHEQRPLNEYWCRVRGVQETEIVRGRYAIDAAASISRGTPAHYDLKQRLYRIDDETMYQPDSHTRDDSLERARTLLMQYVAPWVRDVNGGIPVTTDGSKVVYIPANERADLEYLALCVECPGQKSTLLQPILYYAARAFCNDYYQGDAAMKYIAMGFMVDAAAMLLDPRSTGSVVSNLNRAVEKAAERTANQLTHFPAVRSVYGGYEAVDRTMLIKRPHADAIDSMSQAIGDWRELIYHENKQATRAEYERQANMQIGEVERYEPARYRVPLRLVINGKDDSGQFPPVADHEDLVISGIYGYGYSDTVYIPGYKQVSYDYGSARYGFVADPDGDPYTTCDAHIESAHIAEITEQYRKIGLETLAQQINDSPNLTVGELVEMIRDWSVYHLPETFSAEHLSDRKAALETRDPKFYSISDFADIVKEGKLYVQCTGAATFLQRSLESCFGYGSVGQVTGNVMRGDSRIINAAGHAQVTLVHEGKLYILDATPALDMPISEAYEPLDAAEDYEREQQPATIPPLEIPDRPQEVGEYFEQPDVTPESEIAGLYASLQQQLKIVFEQSDVAGVEKQIIKLAKHDPVRRMYESFARYQSGRVGPEQAGDLAVYIAGCSTSPEATRRKLGLHRYTPEFLEQLASMSHRFHQLSLQLHDD